MNKKKPALALMMVLCSFAFAAGCVLPPSRTPQSETWALPPAESGRLGEVADTITAGLAPGESAFWLLDRADFSFDARFALADRAVESLDIQYFIWEKDPTSRLFSHRIVQAADRGVRVRILLDDLTLNGQDGEFAALDDHPNISVRSFNPWRARRKPGRVLELVFRFGQVNHRMHNKVIVADGRFAILGGRNIGDRYAGVWDEFVQNDLDIMSAGPVVADIAASFDLYWNHELSYSLDDLATQRAAARAFAPTVEMLEQVYRDAADRIRYYPLETSSWDGLLDRLSSDYAPGVGRFVYDPPDVHASPPKELNAPLLELIAKAERRVLLSTAYLVPEPEFVELVAELEARGVEVVLLTNSLGSNNHMIAHTAYKRWRKPLLATGADLYEARDDSIHISEYSVPPVVPGFLGLHSKAIVVDDHLSFVGSPNIDPRSLIINTEVGLFVESEALAAEVAALIERDVSPEAAWRVYTNEKGRLRWVSSEGTVKKQPALGPLQRITAFFINWLPFKAQT
jgi:putative cardiolipin synthase